MRPLRLSPEVRAVFTGLKRWDEGRWGRGNKPQSSRVYTKDPLTHLPSSHLLSPLRYEGFRAFTFLDLLAAHGSGNLHIKGYKRVRIALFRMRSCITQFHVPSK